MQCLQQHAPLAALQLRSGRSQQLVALLPASPALAALPAAPPAPAALPAPVPARALVALVVQPHVVPLVKGVLELGVVKLADGVLDVLQGVGVESWGLVCHVFQIRVDWMVRVMRPC
jgi:hypothetical protein